jgi:hypothetical protein
MAMVSVWQKRKSYEERLKEWNRTHFSPQPEPVLNYF